MNQVPLLIPCSESAIFPERVLFGLKFGSPTQGRLSLLRHVSFSNTIHQDIIKVDSTGHESLGLPELACIRIKGSLGFPALEDLALDLTGFASNDKVDAMVSHSKSMFMTELTIR